MPLPEELELIPADGRDYMTGRAAAEAWNRNVEFIVRTVGVAMNRITRDMAKAGGVKVVTIRFNREDNYSHFHKLRDPGQDWI